MTDNIEIRDAGGNYVTLRTVNTNNIHTPRLYVEPALQDSIATDITANGQTAVINVERVSNIVAHVVASGLSGHTAIFEASINSTDGTNGNWFTVQGVRSNANTIETGVTTAISATPAYSWEVSVNGYKWFRVRATAHTAGTASWTLSPAPFATEPVPAMQNGAQVVLAPSSSVGAPTFKNQVSAAGNNAQNLKNSAANVNDIILCNMTTNDMYFKLYNKSTAPTVGTDVPVRTIYMPPKSSISYGLGTVGIRVSSGLGFALTDGPNNTDTATANITAGAALVQISYT